MPTRGRLAPSPSGYLHLGNAWAFLLTWLACRREGGRLILRMEDLDPERSKPVFAQAIVEDLHWLGLDWDEGPDCGGLFGPYTQGERSVLYAESLRQLSESGHTYPCYCTRRELRDLAQAPHPASPAVSDGLAPSEESQFGDSGAAYPGTCRKLGPNERQRREQEGRRACLRLACPEQNLSFTDSVCGQIQSSPAAFGGDFALQRSDGVIAYQLAVVVDDGRMGISQVVRGADLLASTPRQLMLFDLLGFPRPQYSHVPLLCDADGFRLAKRHGSLSLRALREQGVEAQAVIGYLAFKAALQERPERMAAPTLIPRFTEQSWGKIRAMGQRLALETDPAALLRELSA